MYVCMIWAEINLNRFHIQCYFYNFVLADTVAVREL